MAESVPRSELASRLVSVAGTYGVVVAPGDGRKMTGSQEVIKSKWFLGGRKVVYRLACDVDEAAHIVHFRESAVESSWGVPPPTLTVEKTSQHGSRVSESRVDRGVGGGGQLDYGSVRAAIEQAVRDGGWQFILDAGRMP